MSTWFDPGKEADAAKALIDQGADVLMQHTDSPAAMQIAETKGISAFGQASDMRSFGPNAQLTSIVNNWGPYYIARIKAAMDGSWKSQDIWDGIGPGMVQFAEFSKRIPEDVRKMAAKARDDIAAGKLHLVATLGLERASYGYLLLAVAAFGAVWWLVESGIMAYNSLAALLVLPLALYTSWRIITQFDQRELAMSCWLTIGIQFMTGVLLIGGTYY